MRRDIDASGAYQRTQSGDFFPRRDESGREAFVFVGEIFDLCLELSEPSFFALTAF